MPEFARDAGAAEEMYQNQLRHYGIKQGVLPNDRASHKATTVPSGTKLTAGTGMPIPRRKPVPTGDSSTRGRSPRSASPSRVIDTPSPRTQSPAKTIYRTDGRFDPSTIQAPRQAPTPPASPTSFKPRPRTNSNASTGSWYARRESFGKGFRRLSDAAKNSLNIVKMDRHERLGYVRTKHDEQVERCSTPPAPPSPAPTPPGPRHVAGRFAENLDDEPAQFPPPSTPTKAKPGNLSKGEKIAMSVSRAADSLKPRRKGTQDSDMSFGMTDLAPPGAMQACDDCARPTGGYLINGLCKECHELHVKVAKAKREAWPEVPSVDQRYMKLPSRKKILRIREIIYEDPGNPFDEEAPPRREKPLPLLPPIEGESPTDTDPFDINPFDDGAFSGVPATPKNSVDGVWSSTYTSQDHADSLRRHRRSKSVAVPLSDLKEEFGEYVAPRRYWRKGSVPTSHMSQPIPPSHDPWRDTRFDAFYDEFIQDYGNPKSKM